MSVEEKMRAIARSLPCPLPLHADGAWCPWCGETHATVTFRAENVCYCGKVFYVGVPDWAESEEPLSYAHHTLADHKILDTAPHLAKKFKPNDRLTNIYLELNARESGGWAHA